MQLRLAPRACCAQQQQRDRSVTDSWVRWQRATVCQMRRHALAGACGPLEGPSNATNTVRHSALGQKKDTRRRTHARRHKLSTSSRCSARRCQSLRIMVRSARNGFGLVACRWKVRRYGRRYVGKHVGNSEADFVGDGGGIFVCKVWGAATQDDPLPSESVEARPALPIFFGFGIVSFLSCLACWQPLRRSQNACCCCCFCCCCRPQRRLMARHGATPATRPNRTPSQSPSCR